MDFAQIIELFSELEPDERLEVLMEFGRDIEPLPEVYRKMRDAGLCIVHECQAPVFFMVETVDSRLHVEIDVPEEAPIARGFSAMLKTAFNDVALPINHLPDNILYALGIDGLLGIQRRRGLSAIYSKLHRFISE